MNPLRLSFITACLTAVFGAANAQTSSTANADSHYVSRMSERYQSFAGSNANFESLAVGMRRGSSITLTEGAESVTFAPPTRPMGYGNITRAIDLASRQLSTAGIAEPTPEQVQAALMGGTVSTPKGDVTLQGVLQLRSQGMGWGQIAHAVGVHPGLRTGSAPAPGTSGASGITNASGGSISTPGAKLKSAHSASSAQGRSGMVTGAGAVSMRTGANPAPAHGGQGNAFGRGGKP